MVNKERKEDRGGGGDSSFLNTELLTVLKKDFPQFFNSHGIFDREKFLAELPEQPFPEPHAGCCLQFIGREFARLQANQAPSTVIVPDHIHNIIPNHAASANVFITGDNLEALRHLVNAYYNRIKMIYIDPPYNTGHKDFIYPDNFEYTDEYLKETLGYGEKEINRLRATQGKGSHSAWLSFMYPRLKLARTLLREDGLMFISIDDNELAHLRLLMNDIFGERNFVANFIWQKKGGPGNTAKIIGNITEYIMLFAKNKKPGILKYRNIIHTYRYRDRISAYNLENIEKANKGMYERPTMHFAITDPETGKVFMPRQGKRWTIGKKTAQALIQKKKLFFDYKKNRVKRIKRPSDYEMSENVYLNLLTRYGSLRSAKDEIYTLCGVQELFDTPKPVALIKHLVEIATAGHDIIFDFFAGSGTTAQAVMQLNAEDGGNRTFILVQLDEPVHKKSEAFRAGFKTIDEIAQRRIICAAHSLKNKTPLNTVDCGFKHYRLIQSLIQSLSGLPEDMIKSFSYPLTQTTGVETLLSTFLIKDGCMFDTEVVCLEIGAYTAYYVRERGILYLIESNWTSDTLKIVLNILGKKEIIVDTVIVYRHSFSCEDLSVLRINMQTNLDNPPTLIER
jgi:adenine-specific DNA-methyltransferase